MKLSGSIGRKALLGLRDNPFKNSVYLHKMSNLGKVKHDQVGNRFYLELDDGHKAEILYEWIDHEGHRIIQMYHTEVPEHLRGRGIGRGLARGAFEYITKTNTKCKLTCSYLENYIKKFASESERQSIIA